MVYCKVKRGRDYVIYLRLSSLVLLVMRQLMRAARVLYAYWQWWRKRRSISGYRFCGAARTAAAEEAAGDDRVPGEAPISRRERASTAAAGRCAAGEQRERE